VRNREWPDRDSCAEVRIVSVRPDQEGGHHNEGAPCLLVMDFVWGDADDDPLEGGDPIRPRLITPPFTLEEHIGVTLRLAGALLRRGPLWIEEPDSASGISECVCLEPNQFESVLVSLRDHVRRSGPGAAFCLTAWSIPMSPGIADARAALESFWNEPESLSHWRNAMNHDVARVIVGNDTIAFYVGLQLHRRRSQGFVGWPCPFND
jgi:hypothetical protein